MTQVKAGSRAVAAGIDPATLAGGLPTLLQPHGHAAADADKDYGSLGPRRPTADGTPGSSAAHLPYDGLPAGAASGQLLSQQYLQQQLLPPLISADMVNAAWSAVVPAGEDERHHAAWPQSDGDVFASDRATVPTDGGHDQHHTESLLNQAALAAYGIRRLSINSVTRGLSPRGTRTSGHLRRLHSSRWSTPEVGCRL